MAQKTEGIQQLLVAEKKASEKVAEARKRKAQKLKNAKKEADAEIINCKTERENIFTKLQNEELGKKSNSEAQIQVLTNQKLKEHETMMKNNRGRTMKALMEALFNIEVQLHENARL